MKIYILLYQALIHFFLYLINTSTVATTCKFNGCYDSERNPRPCMASPVNMAYKRNISSTNTCGNPAGGFCELGPGLKCFECDASKTDKKHSPIYMVDKEFDTPYSLEDVTWWQSQTWWETNQLGMSNQFNPMRVNITLSFGRRFHISGGITVRFYNERPMAMFLEKSEDFGKTWKVLQYFAFKCSMYYKMPGMEPVPKNNPFEATCTEDYSGQFPPRYGKVEYRYDKRYDGSCSYFDEEIQNYMLATNVRVRLEYPYTDGLEKLFQTEEILNKYYYAISDIVITGRCDCNGHAQYCTGPRMKETCECEHKTMGQDCEMCKSMFNNRPWMPANASHANECQECACNNHGLSCVYNDTLGYGVCTSCQHNTKGPHCETCVPKYYRNANVPLQDLNTCIACDCFPEGITNNGTCLPEATPTQEIGQCQCKENVFGRQCDQCIPGYWGYRGNPAAECKVCGCNILGTFNNTIQCDQYTGDCPCKESVQGRYCVECKDGFYLFPLTKDSDCLRCPCDLGGAFPQCNKLSGSCSCRPGVEGSECERSQQGHFYPTLDFIHFEVEEMRGTFTALTLSEGHGVDFSGHGFAILYTGQYAHIDNAKVSASHQFYAVLRYSITQSCKFHFSAKLVLGITSTNQNISTEFDVLMEKLPQGTGKTWRSPQTVTLLTGKVYNFSLTYNSTGDFENCSVHVDSLVFLPDVNTTRAYTESERDIQDQLHSCAQAALSLAASEPAYCYKLVYSTSTEIYNGTLACGCDPVGSVIGTQCAAYGGQCQCHPGVVGRICDSCINGFYGFSSKGCKRCQCSSSGSLHAACHLTTGKCQCKANVEGHNCDSCKDGSFNLVGANKQGWLSCFGYGRASGCESASGFVASTISSEFENKTEFDWVVVNRTGDVIPFVDSASNGLVVTSVIVPPVMYISAPFLFLGRQFRSYGQKLHVKLDIKDPGNGLNLAAADGDVILASGSKEVALNFIPLPSPNVTSYHVILDETHVIDGQSVPSLEFVSILAELTSLKLRASYFPQSTVTFKEVTLETAASEQGIPGEVSVGFVENATCHTNYTGLSCELCAPGYTREVNGSGPSGRCVLCSCNNRSIECDGETGACTNCQVGTYGDRCHLCTNNVQGPECTQCEPGYWGLSENGCKACECHPIGTAFGNTTLCDQVTGQCVCNTTARIGGRRCDRCMENSWNTSNSLFSCKECSSCYSSIQEDVNIVRARIQLIENDLSALMKNPALVHNLTFAKRLHQLVTEVSALSQTISRALEVEGNSTSQWLTFAVAYHNLSANLNHTETTSVNRTLHYAAVVDVNRKEIASTVTQIHDVVREASRLLGTPMRLELEQNEVLSKSLAVVAEELTSVAEGLIEHANRTVIANQTIFERVESALKTTNDASEKAQNANSTRVEVTNLLQPLYENASAANALGEQTVTLMLSKLTSASKAYNDSVTMMAEASQPNSDRSSVLQDLKRKTIETRNLAENFLNQTSELYQSSAAVAGQVSAAMERSLRLEEEVHAVLLNGTHLLRGSQAALSSAQASVSRAKNVHEYAQRMLTVASNFEAESRQVQASANRSLLTVASARANAHNILRNVFAVNESSANSLLTAEEALQLGDMVEKFSTFEKQVAKKVLRLANSLWNETTVENVVDNATMEDFMARKIEPIEKLCKNLSTKAFNLSNNGHIVLHRAVHANITVQRLIILIRRLMNESSGLPRVSVDELPTIKEGVNSATQQFDGLQLQSQLEELRRDLQLQKTKMSMYKEQIHQLRSDVQKYKDLVRSIPSVTVC
ncbi:laminin subunit alpha-3-like isoform X1 [Stylophora pistillata]|uniref:laminin subunit alpha-3-like isoform X1 n=2 Tax=Stylophora pistillata TaxID=50429 RepID=UPI000C04EDCC|nr:laminin subunit alpha-3-like isoform X1 [Stylophora pistillata]